MPAHIRRPRRPRFTMHRSAVAYAVRHHLRLGCRFHEDGRVEHYYLRPEPGCAPAPIICWRR